MTQARYELEMHPRNTTIAEPTNRDGYEGRVPTTYEGISEARKRAAMWLAFAGRSSS